MVTLYYAGIFGIMYLFLGFYVVKNRRLHRISLGTGKDVPALERAVWIHGNFSENIPLFLILLMLIEMHGTPYWLLHIFAIFMLVGRILHALGIRHKEGASRERFFGMLLTWLAILLASLVAIYLSLHNGFVMTLEMLNQ